MNLCECGCYKETPNKYIKGHKPKNTDYDYLRNEIKKCESCSKEFKAMWNQKYCNFLCTPDRYNKKDPCLFPRKEPWRKMVESKWEPFPKYKLPLPPGHKITKRKWALMIKDSRLLNVPVERSWLKWESFLADMGESPLNSRLSRKDTTKGFTKINVFYKIVKVNKNKDANE